MIIVALGSNLPTLRYGNAQANLIASLLALSDRKVKVLRRSRWYRSAPYPPSGQPWYVNAVAEVETMLAPDELLVELHAIEADFGRVRRETNEARVLDLDLIAYHDLVTRAESHLRLPHPRMAERAFVVLPLLDIDPGWRHPVSGLTAKELSLRLPGDQEIEVVEEDR